ncbi:MAG: outer membrane beta-barrel protein [Brumimicrobium sp.]
MKLRSVIVIICTILLSYSAGFSQSHRVRSENFFGLQFRPLIPLGMVGDKTFTISEGELESTIKPIFGYSYGGVVRVGITELLAIETGLNYTKRRYQADHAVVDSNVYASEKLGYVSFEVPLNLLIYVKLGNQFYMNVAGGASVNYNPSNIRSPKPLNPFGIHLFIFEGRRYNHFDFHANAEVGFEFRSEKLGTFYLGMNGRIPFNKVLQIATEYRHDTHSVVAYGDITGATFSVSIKYFLPNIKKRGEQPVKGPIEF